VPNVVANMDHLNGFTLNPHHLNGVMAPMVSPINGNAASFANGLVAAAAAPPVMSNGLVLDNKAAPRIVLIQQADGSLVTAASSAALAPPGMHYTVAGGLPQVSVAQAPLAAHHQAVAAAAASHAAAFGGGSAKKKRKSDDLLGHHHGGKKGKGGRGGHKGPPPPPAQGTNVKAALPSTTTLSTASTDSETRAIRNSYVTEVSSFLYGGCE